MRSASSALHLTNPHALDLADGVVVGVRHIVGGVVRGEVIWFLKLRRRARVIGGSRSPRRSGEGRYRCGAATTGAVAGTDGTVVFASDKQQGEGGEQNRDGGERVPSHPCE
jgi:hypothetical protein